MTTSREAHVMVKCPGRDGLKTECASGPVDNHQSGDLKFLHRSKFVLLLSTNCIKVLAPAAILIASAGSAHADPCKAIPDRGAMPAYLAPGMKFSGPVTYVGDGDSLCVSVAPGAAGMVEVRVADFYAPELNSPGGREAKAALEGIAFGNRAVCTAQHRSHDRVVAVCRINGRSVGDLMRRAGVSEGGNGR